MSDDPPSRRRLLGLLGASVTTAGCLGFGDTDDTTSRPPTTRDGTPTGTARDQTATSASTAGERTATPPLARRGVPAEICEKEQQRPGPDGIYAVVDPAFAPDWSDVNIPDQYQLGDSGIPDDGIVVGLEHDGAARAYPLVILWWHEIVNDTFGVPTLVTYCPLCRSGMVAERTVGGEPTAFTVTELLWVPPGVATNRSVSKNRTFGVGIAETEVEVRERGNLVFTDAATGSYWSQLLARAICGPKRGEQLDILPSQTARWGDWKAAHPDTDVLLPPPHSGVSLI